MQNFLDLLKKIRPVDFIIIAGVLIALIVGFFTFANFRQTAEKQIEATSKIRFQVYIRSVTLTGDEFPIHKGAQTFISIRNVPYSDLDIVDVQFDRKKIVLPTFNSKKVVVVEDVSQASLYDIVVTLEDTAKITKDGAVLGGNKIKMGLPITLEGEDYKFNGIVSNIQQVVPVSENHDVINQNSAYDVQ